MNERSDAVSLERLTLVSRVGWLELVEPVFVDAGGRVWADFDARQIVIEHSSGKLQRLASKPTAPDSMR